MDFVARITMFRNMFGARCGMKEVEMRYDVGCVLVTHTPIYHKLLGESSALSHWKSPAHQWQ